MRWLPKMLGKSKRGKGGFTLIELMIVVIIVGILAAAAVPIYTSYVQKAYKTEADASLGAIRTAEIAYKAENGDFTTTIGTGGLEMTSDDFTNNRYFDIASFSIVTSGGSTYAVCNGADSNATGSTKVSTIIRKIDISTGELSDGSP